MLKAQLSLPPLTVAFREVKLLFLIVEAFPPFCAVSLVHLCITFSPFKNYSFLITKAIHVHYNKYEHHRNTEHVITEIQNM